MSNKTILVINCGSSSIKFSLFSLPNFNELLTGLAEKLNGESPQIKYQFAGKDKGTLRLNSTGHNNALKAIVDILTSFDEEHEIAAIGHRVVHGGEDFSESALIDSQVLKTIEECVSLAPLHNPNNLIGINAMAEIFNGLPQVAVFDTAFHQTIPRHAYIYPVNYKWYQKHKVRRYGFHGTSHLFVANEFAKIENKNVNELSIITAHLGNGCSICAIKNGNSVDTSMGFTPLEGLMMGTRCGDIDPSMIEYIEIVENKNTKQVIQELNKSSGLLGVSQVSNDMRELHSAIADGKNQAKLALDIFCYRLAKYIASYIVPLGRLDGLVFTGGIGENDSLVRAQVIQQLEFMNLMLDTDKNTNLARNTAGLISKDNSIPVYVIPTNEELVIAKDTAQLAKLEVV